MMKGRGLTTCLICDKGCDYVVFNNMQIIYGIKLLFDTDQVKAISQFCLIISLISISPSPSIAVQYYAHEQSNLH